MMPCPGNSSPVQERSGWPCPVVCLQLTARTYTNFQSANGLTYAGPCRSLSQRAREKGCPMLGTPPPTLLTDHLAAWTLKVLFPYLATSPALSVMLYEADCDTKQSPTRSITHELVWAVPQSHSANIVTDITNWVDHPWRAICEGGCCMVSRCCGTRHAAPAR